jgi:hypothetical protein
MTNFVFHDARHVKLAGADQDLFDSDATSTGPRSKLVVEISTKS